jgi:hypothetical protein
VTQEGRGYSIDNYMSRCDWQEENGDVECGLMDVISRGFFIVLLRVLLFEFGDYEGTDRLDQGLHVRTSAAGKIFKYI